jgi:sugar O-acyltransferase (sialic acid O-acetyltransferase NeuD family)
MEKVVLFGNGPVAKATYLTLTHDSANTVAGFTVDREYIDEETLFDLPVVPFDTVESYFSADEYQMFIAIGYARVNQLRAKRYYQAKGKGYQLISHVSSRAIVTPEVVIGENSLIGANCVISAFVQIGNNVTIGSGTFIGHDTIINDHCFLSNCVAVAGKVTIEPYSFLGIGATIRNRIRIARECVIGAGSLILQDTKEREVYLGKAAELLSITSDKLPIR